MRSKPIEPLRSPRCGTGLRSRKLHTFHAGGAEATEAGHRRHCFSTTLMVSRDTRFEKDRKDKPAHRPSSCHAPVRSSLLTGLLSLAALVAFVFTPTGAVFLWLGVLAGIVGIEFGIVALRHHRPDPSAVIGIVTDSISVLFGLGRFVFALVPVGTIPT